MSTSSSFFLASGIINGPVSDHSIHYGLPADWALRVPFYNYFKYSHYFLTTHRSIIKRGHHVLAWPTRYYGDAEILMKRTLIASRR